MSKVIKDLKRLETNPKDLTYNEAKRILNNLGFFEDNKGRTSGSRVEFRNSDNKKIQLHKPHPGRILNPIK